MTKLNKTDLLSLEEYSERREELRAGSYTTEKR
jgi:hypothetical protein